AVSYKNASVTTIRTDRYRLIRHKNDYVELYDHSTKAAETKNVADANPDVVKSLGRLLQDRLTSLVSR
ncbi:MAG: iduronate-2-sulfatase, partial [Planctomycetaceae bacterium]